ncbi:MAG: hypothetical protein WA790_15795 [Sulfitobacter sp.]
MSDLTDRLREDAIMLGGNSINNGCLDCGLSSNTSNEAADRIDALEAALLRIATPQAFFVATSSVDPEAYARMIYAESILGDYTLKAASDKAEYETRRRYARAALSGEAG